MRRIKIINDSVGVNQRIIGYGRGKAQSNAEPPEKIQKKKSK